MHFRLCAFWPFPRRLLNVLSRRPFVAPSSVSEIHDVKLATFWRHAYGIYTRYLVRGAIFVTWCYFSPCVPVVKRVDPTLTDKEAKIGHSQFLDIVDSYDVFHHARFIVNFNRETYGIVKNWQIINTVHIGSEMNFHCIRYLWNELCVLYPRAFGEGI